MEKMYSSPSIAKEVQRVYGDKAKVVDVPMRHEQTVRRFVTKIEQAHKDAAKSKLVFK